jgi:hypothetical protein
MIIKEGVFMKAKDFVNTSKIKTTVVLVHKNNKGCEKITAFFF